MTATSSPLKPDSGFDACGGLKLTPSVFGSTTFGVGTSAFGGSSFMNTPFADLEALSVSAFGSMTLVSTHSFHLWCYIATQFIHFQEVSICGEHACICLLDNIHKVSKYWRWNFWGVQYLKFQCLCYHYCQNDILQRSLRMAHHQIRGNDETNEVTTGCKGRVFVY